MNDVKVKVKKRDLIAALQANKDRHEKFVAEAREGWRKKAVDAIDKRRAEILAGTANNLNFDVNPPEDYSKAYDRTIRTFGLHTGDDIELSVDEVDQYVHDRWHWRDRFLASSSGYSASAAVEAARE